MSDIVTELNEALLEALKGETLVLLGTVDAESNGPSVSAISWMTAVDFRLLRFAVDARSRIVGNVKQNPKVSVTLFAGESVHTVYGTANVISDSLADVPFPLACVDIRVESVRDAMFYGAKIAVEPKYEKTYDKRAAEKLDNQVFSAMNKA
ncbi:pyridoxamine 5'-phosphate oxidase family protein [Paenibacillus turpanensis]|uniref:pyridoxamine 5'-phosphate oxidase family protein n=1 Tax=Paenibacillus turpanensis TaxID=2689078 RepID=UPI00140A7FFE|nr:pyridoxamine 5'-phosphate oxidase family protein [Paenibacillus turpanensis]